MGITTNHGGAEKVKMKNARLARVTRCPKLASFFLIGVSVFAWRLLPLVRGETAFWGIVTFSIDV
jgi:hypothetical protein